MKRLITSCFGLGYLPAAPGTWGSVPPVIIFMLLVSLGFSAWVISLCMLLLVVAASFFCVLYTPSVAVAVGKKDPSEVVIDEFAGQSACFVLTAFFVSSPCIAGITGFVLFRFFDILKPPPVRRLETLPEGWGVLLDDIMAGIYAAVVFVFLHSAGVFEIFSGGLCTVNSGINVLTAAFLGAVQGVTEFLPVSSSGHLVLLETLFDYKPETAGMLIFDLVTHLGTLLAIFVVFAGSFRNFAGDLGKVRNYGPGMIRIYRRSPAVHILVLAVIATVVTGVLGMIFKKVFMSARGDLVLVAIMWIITGTLLFAADYRRKTRIGLREFGILAAVIVGVAQAAAIMPGISRSGATICAAILVGLHRRWAVEFSFMLAIPAIAGATLIESAGNFDQISSGALGWDVMFFGGLSAFLVGVISLKLLIKVSRGAHLKYFAFYCWLLAAVVLILSVSR